ncbi:unnamed protein product [Discosporangium mesarthrocarpum]
MATCGFFSWPQKSAFRHASKGQAIPSKYYNHILVRHASTSQRACMSLGRCPSKHTVTKAKQRERLKGSRVCSLIIAVRCFQASTAGACWLSGRPGDSQPKWSRFPE